MTNMVISPQEKVEQAEGHLNKVLKLVLGKFSFEDFKKIDEYTIH